MPYQLNLNQSQILTSLRAVLLTALPAGLEVVQGQVNRAPEPIGTDFVVMTPILRSRIETNTDLYEDVAFTGSIAGTTLTITAVAFGTIQLNASLFGTGVTVNTLITAQTSGTLGGIGVYTLSISQTLASGPLAAGLVGLLQPTQITVQCDVHGPNSADNCQLISTLLRSIYGCDLFTAQGFDVTSLYASEPRESPFTDAEQQVEMMWTVDAVLAANQIMLAPQQFAGRAQAAINWPADSKVRADWTAITADSTTITADQG